MLGLELLLEGGGIALGDGEVDMDYSKSTKRFLSVKVGATGNFLQKSFRKTFPIV